MNERDTHRTETIARLFAVLTAILEDAAGLAVEGQGATAERSAELASRLVELSQQTTTLSEALIIILEGSSA